MGRRTKAQEARLKNLSTSKNHQKASVEEVPEEIISNENVDMLENGFFFLDDACDGEELDDDEEEGEEDGKDEDEDRGHLCDFYPKYHCELNFIEQYWGAAKLVYRISPKTSNMKEMEANVKASLDDVPHVSIQCYANWAARFISAYEQGFGGPEAAWANKKYHGHRTLPPDIAMKLKKEHEERYPTT